MLSVLLICLILRIGKERVSVLAEVIDVVVESWFLLAVQWGKEECSRTSGSRGFFELLLGMQCPVRKVSSKVEPGGPGLSLQPLERLKQSDYKFKAAWATE